MLLVLVSVWPLFHADWAQFNKAMTKRHKVPPVQSAAAAENTEGNQQECK